MPKVTLDELYERMKDVLVGIWRFRAWKKGSEWCCTWVLDGVYYDTYPKPTPHQAAMCAWRNYQRALKRKAAK